MAAERCLQRELARAQYPICVRNITETFKQNIPTLHNSTISTGALLHSAFTQRNPCATIRQAVCVRTVFLATDTLHRSMLCMRSR
ncbi:hypothetical protein FQK02_22360 [Xanthomonas vasicola]|uniref:Uncharacterized protein n=1 Tax=Xanthomonas vasicola pv. vasculorum NCPPB 890 TaxID=1184265 RepID=A0A836ZTV1_XANVA|nr:hypothetical protein [Xanthomonas vasicola]KFA27122.1 hypothetical protein KW5_0112880 [Xanthomonas vasicola pv. vasculorum NCPPB 1326]KFA29403.1 hypothetical protein KWG_0115595 [Xanthomonas vasicola pv. vasculorum NCPPB 1381]AZR36695.1 hypothetical protein NX08_022040 [Xanthomonas vasicola]KGR50482.1 hypothetical protein NX07_16570 [Xanthomonas vasicola]KGR50891.1 hypothetical protein NX09_20155 [Xanthomonas vasicola]